jgi:hypothetical protein
MDPQKIKVQIIRDLSGQIPELAEGDNDFVLNRLTSKKNIVFELIFKKKPQKFPKIVILKLFQTEFAEIEYSTLKKLENQDISIPKVLFYKKPYIILEKINGINLTTYINSNLKSITSLKELKHQIRKNLKHGIKECAKWLAMLHKNNLIDKTNEHGYVVLNKGDTRLRDFIYNPSTGSVHGMDFEESYEGNFHDDLAWICCSLLDTNPGIFEMDDPRHKIELIKVFLKKYFKVNSHFPFSFEYFAERLIENINIVIERRELEIGQVREEMILKKISGIL